MKAWDAMLRRVALLLGLLAMLALPAAAADPAKPAKPAGKPAASQLAVPLPPPAAGKGRTPPTALSLYPKALVIGTGVVTGVYFPAGGAICRLLNRGRADHGVRCLVEPSEGSVQNINALRAGDIDLAIIQSDTHFHALKGNDPFTPFGPFDELRSVFSIHTESLTILARSDSNIRSVKDLYGRRISLGPAGSGPHMMMEDVVAAMGWGGDALTEVNDLSMARQEEALCDGKVDAIAYTVGHPNGTIQSATTACDTVAVEIAGPEIDKMLASHPFYAKATIPGGLYAGNPVDVDSFGIKATLVATTRTDPETIYQLVKAVFENFEDFKRQHPVFYSLTKEQMIRDGMTAPIHQGAMRYFVEAGLL